MCRRHVHSLTRAGSLACSAQTIAADLCAFPKPGQHESREGQQPVYQVFFLFVTQWQCPLKSALSSRSAAPRPFLTEPLPLETPIQYFRGDPESADYINGLLLQYQPDIQERAEILCRSWTTNGAAGQRRRRRLISGA